MKPRDISGISTAHIIAALNGNRAALNIVRGYTTGCWLRTAEGDAAAQRLAELSEKLAERRTIVSAPWWLDFGPVDWRPPQGKRTPGLPPWQAGRRLNKATP